MGEGMKSGAGGAGAVVNGIIQQYKAQAGVISPSTFIEFINDTSKFTAIDGYATATGSVISSGTACEIDSTRVLFYYRLNSLNPFACVIKFDGSTITAGTPLNIAQSTSSQYYDYGGNYGRDLVKMPDGSFLLGYYSYLDMAYVSFIKMTVSNMTITRTGLGSTALTASGVQRCLKILPINNTQAILLYTTGATCYLYVRPITVGTSSVTFGTALTLSSREQSASIASAVKYADNRFAVFDAHGNLYDCSISGTTLTKLATYSIPKYSSQYLIGAMALVDDGALLCVGNAATTNLFKIKFNNGIEFTHSLKVPGGTVSNSALCLMRKLGNGNVFINIGTLLWKVDMTGGIPTISNSLQFYSGTMPFGNNYVFCMSSYSTSSERMYLKFYNFDNLKTLIVPAASKIEGVTKTKATTEAPGKVWVLG